MFHSHRAGVRRAIHTPHRHLLASLLLAVLLILSSAPALFAQDASDEPLDLLMGQLATGDFAAGESVSYIIDLPESTTYVITTGDDAAAAKFTLVITDRRGNEVYNDVFQTTQLDMKSGDHTFTLTANEDATLSLFVTGQFGKLSEDYGEGELFNGSFVTAENVENSLYASLDIEDTDVWQQAFVTISGGDGDAYSIYVSGEDAYASVSDTSTGAPAVFWTRGGTYNVEIDPVSGGDSLTLVVLLSGPVPALTVGEATSGSFQPGTTQKAYRFTVDEAGAQYIVHLAADTQDVDIDVAASINPTSDTWSAYSSGSNETLTFVAPLAGEYFVRLFTSSTVSEPVDYTLTVEAGEPAPILAANGQTWGTVTAGQRNLYLLPVDENEDNALLVVAMAANPDVDLDLSVQQMDDQGSVVTSMSSANSGSLELTSQLVQQPAMIMVEVNGSYASEDTPYVLNVTLQPAGAIGAQWADSATASSQFGDPGYAPAAATGPADISTPSDNPLAWTSKDPDAGEETLELTYANPVVPTGIRIFESYNPGAVTKVEAYDADADAWSVLWEGSEPTDEAIRVFSPALEAPDFRTTQIRLTLATDAVPGWNEIDAVQLLGLP